ncbi:MAG: DUF4340 domain-containing protein [Alphaproteobacteria bacterium]|nr:DUF4340 domain-containing protein [Alphaproteobacteria bacterium]
MKKSIIATLGAAAVIAVAGAAWTVHQRAAQLAGTGRVAPLLPGLVDKLGQVEQVELRQDATVIKLARSGDHWVAPDKAGYPAKFETVRKNLVALADLKTLEAKTTKSDLHGRLQVEAPTGAGAKSIGITLKDAKGTVLADLIVGKRRANLSGGADRTYVRKAGDNQAWLAEGSLDLRMDAAEWLERDIVNLPGQRFREAVNVQPDGKRVTVRRDKPEDTDLKIVGIAANAKIKSQYTVNAIAGALESLTLDDVRPARELEFKPSGGWAELKATDGLVVKVEIASKDDKSWIRLVASYQAPAAGAPAAADAKTPEQVQDEVKAINARVGNWAYHVSQYKMEKFQAKLADLLDDQKSS